MILKHILEWMLLSVALAGCCSYDQNVILHVESCLTDGSLYKITCKNGYAIKVGNSWFTEFTMINADLFFDCLSPLELKGYLGNNYEGYSVSNSGDYVSVHSDFNHSLPTLCSYKYSDFPGLTFKGHENLPVGGHSGLFIGNNVKISCPEGKDVTVQCLGDKLYSNTGCNGCSLTTTVDHVTEDLTVSVGRSATGFNCADGYTSANTIKCVENNKWDKKACNENRCTLDDAWLGEGSIPGSTTNSYSVSTRFVCNNGKEVTLYCLSDGTKGQQPDCSFETGDCSRPIISEYEEKIIEIIPSYIQGSFTLTLTDGYEFNFYPDPPQTSVTLVCDHGTLNYDTLTIEKIKCSFYNSALNAQLILDDDNCNLSVDPAVAVVTHQNFTGVCREKCNRGYSLPDGISDTFSCTTSQDFNADNSTPCEQNICTINQSEFKNGQFSPKLSSNEIRGHATFNCNEGYAPSSNEHPENAFDLYCMKNADGSFSIDITVNCVEINECINGYVNKDGKCVAQEMPLWVYILLGVAALIAICLVGLVFAKICLSPQYTHATFKSSVGLDAEVDVKGVEIFVN